MAGPQVTDAHVQQEVVAAREHEHRHDLGRGQRLVAELADQRADLREDRCLHRPAR
ncbi:hypothetical protein [Umezawaea beigongshangensis]|uniref:hypothetical protein n=1 Tax=Umezawaea beigongshangensis TaxID=2780383 RepID=UPI001E5BD6BD|nr:hypothetical protein [Umezawaea beigongshangensis]